VAPVTEPDPAAPPPTDPVLVRRAQAARLAGLGQRIGYTCFGIAVVVFLIGVIIDFTPLVSGIVIGAILVGSVVLAPAIVAGYAVKAAVRDDLEHGRAVE
jgi:cytochrome c biogenesis protein ResB